MPIFLRHFLPEVGLERIDRLPRDERVERIFLLKLSAVQWLVRAFNFDSNRGLTLLDDRDGLVVELDRCSVIKSQYLDGDNYSLGSEHTLSPN